MIISTRRGTTFFVQRLSRVDVIYNKELVDPKELKSYWDLLNPKWRGKIVAFSHIQSPHRYFYYHPDLGPKFLTRLYSDMKVVQSDSMRQIADWLAVGKFSIAVPANGSHRDVKSAQTQGLPIGTFKPDQFKEGAKFNTTIGIVRRAAETGAAPERGEAGAELALVARRPNSFSGPREALGGFGLGSTSPRTISHPMCAGLTVSNISLPKIRNSSIRSRFAI